MKSLIFSFIFISITASRHVFANYSEVNILGGTRGLVEDTDIIKKRLPIYHSSSCIEELLRQVVKANRGYYDPNKYFYSLSFKKEGGKRYLVIESGKYKSSRVFDYVGVMKIYGSIFLCRGDIASDTLFKSDNDAFLSVHLERKKVTKDFDYGVEPSLRGLYQQCNGIKISLEIYTRASLPGYKMEELKSKKPTT